MSELFAHPIAELERRGIAPPDVTMSPAGGKGLALDELGRIPSSIRQVGQELAYVEFDADKTSTSTTFAGGTEVVSAGALTFDGATKIRVEFFAPSMNSSTTAASAIVSLADGGAAGTDLGLIAVCANTDNTPVHAVREFTPAAGTKPTR